MILNPTSSHSIEILLDAAVATNQLPFTATVNNFNQAGKSTYATHHGVTNGTTAVAVCVPMDAERHIMEFFSVHNADTATRIVTLRLNANGTTRTIIRQTLVTLESLEWTKWAGWQVMGP